ncbi:hypothetical protein EVJ58_g4355 [Rhodofomes roseus]|uniref:Uncharacterized protein n=1 Tax=Rhodofomes roseus TaxID=34475 RepID=A0A4Y9YL74_9APHY|nr:hypothetical protein EVJ58_g4355 [Rhodofomes roseus]
MAYALRFRTIDSIVASVEAHSMPHNVHADYLCREAKIVGDILKDDMIADEQQSYGAWNEHVENSKLGGSARYLDAAERFWRFVARTYRDVAARREAEVVRPPPAAAPQPPPPASSANIVPSPELQPRQPHGTQPAIPSIGQMHGPSAWYYRPRYAMVTYVPGLVAGWAAIQPPYFPMCYQQWPR